MIYSNKNYDNFFFHLKKINGNKVKSVPGRYFLHFPTKENIKNNDKELLKIKSKKGAKMHGYDIYKNLSDKDYKSHCMDISIKQNNNSSININGLDSTDILHLNVDNNSKSVVNINLKTKFNVSQNKERDRNKTKNKNKRYDKFMKKKRRKFTDEDNNGKILFSPT